MRSLSLLLLACALALAATPAWAQEGGAGGDTSFTLLAEFEGGQYVWKNENGDTNPTLNMPANSQGTITIQQGESSADVPHNIQVGGGEVSDQIQAPGDSLTYSFNSPPSGTVDYVCTIHPTTMKGTISVGGAGGENTEGNDTPAPGLVALLVGLAGIALLVRRR